MSENSNSIDILPENWQFFLKGYLDEDALNETIVKLNKMRESAVIFPPAGMIFSAFNLTKPEDVQVVIMGQDPYHEPGQAHGLSFSVQDGAPLPPSLKNIYWELYNDLGINRKSGCLEDWKEQGVLLLNTVLTVREHEANSHKNIGWEEVTKAILEIVMEVKKDTVFLLWGNQAYNTYMEAYKMFTYNGYPTWIHVIRSAHPSPLSARRGFIGSHPFSATNDILRQCKVIPINW
jgi:uracil-DNA glycosylase